MFSITPRISRLIRSSKLTYALLILLLILFLRRSNTNEEEEPPQLLVVNNEKQWTEALSSKINTRQQVLKDDFEDTAPSSGKWFKGMKKSSLGPPEYEDYSKTRHPPFSDGPLRLPYMRPKQEHRTFTSPAIEKVISDLARRVKDADLFRIFENSFPNTLDTTILWFDKLNKDTETPRTFISTGDIHAEWLRDSARQLAAYQQFTPYDENLQAMIKGAIIQQAIYIIKAPYCNAFQPPDVSGIVKRPSSIDFVSPRPPWHHVFECKWELDSLASFLTLTNDYFKHSKDFSIFKNELWLKAFDTILIVLKRESSPTFDENGNLLPFYYTFQRETRIGTETLPLAGTGNPVNGDTGLIRSAFRPSDDACTYQLFIPANAQMATELSKLSPLLAKYSDSADGAETSNDRSKLSKYYAKLIKQGIEEYGIITHPKFGKVFAYEIDGFGSSNIMDDANIPSLLALPDMEYISKTDSVYQNTRKMILSKAGNPYYLKGKYFKGIGGPHIGLQNAWPMSLLIQIRTSVDDEEIIELLDLLKKTTAGLGLMHESINVNSILNDYTRPWFSWCNSEFGKTILYLAAEKPYLIFKKEYRDVPYVFKG